MHVRRFAFRRLLILLAPLALLALPADGSLNDRYLCLDGADDYASAADHSSLDVGTGDGEDFTLETFFYVPDTSNNTWDTLIWKQGSYGLYVLYNFSLAGGADRFIYRIWTGANDYVFLLADTQLSAGWHHVAAIWDNEHTDAWDYMALYVDGALVASGSNLEMTPGLLNTTSPLQLGAVNGTNAAAGGLEETRISGVVRYSGPSFAVPSVPFVTDADTRALWHFDATPGATSFIDSTANANTATGINGAQTCGLACTPITLIPSSLSGGTHGVSYDQTLDASGGDAPYSFAVTTGTLPPGLSLSSAGLLSGTPSSVGSFEFDVTATDSSACTGTQTYTISISCPSITVTPSSLPGCVAGSPCNATLGASGGTAPHSFAVTGGALPPGLSLSAGGSLSGSPSATGTFAFTVTATDAQACTGTQQYALTVYAPYGPPSYLAATATGATQTALQWEPVSGVATYEVHRATSKSGPFVVVGTPAATSFADTVPAANTTYIYKVRQSGGGAADFSPIDVATTTVFTDPSLAGVPIRAVHVEQLRTAVDAMRAAAGLAPATFTDASLAGVAVRRVHLVELRSALDAARASLGLPAVAYTDPVITAGVTPAKGAHVLELRQGTQ